MSFRISFMLSRPRGTTRQLQARRSYPVSGLNTIRACSTCATRPHTRHVTVQVSPLMKSRRITQTYVTTGTRDLFDSQLYAQVCELT